MSSGENHLADTSRTNLNQNHYENVDSDEESTAEQQENIIQRFHHFQKKLWVLLEEPSSSWPAAIISLFISFLIVFSAVTLCLETLPEFYGKNTSIWLSLELVSVIFFTIEYFLRLFAASYSRKQFIEFIKSPFHFIDLLGFVPFYIHILLLAILDERGFDTKQFAVFRVLRLLRILRLSRFSIRLKSFFKALARSVKQLVLILLFMMLAVLFFSTSIYYAERGEYNESKGYFENNGEKSEFQSIPQAFWWCIVTMSTTGYGDVVPQTPLGRFVAICTMTCGVLIIAIPSMIVDRNLGEIKDERRRMERLRRFNTEQQLFSTARKNINSDQEVLISSSYNRNYNTNNINNNTNNNTNNNNNNNNAIEMVPTFRTSLDIFRENIRQSVDQQTDQSENIGSSTPRASVDTQPRVSLDAASESNDTETLITALKEQDAQISHSIDHLQQALAEVSALQAAVRQTLDAIPRRMY